MKTGLHSRHCSLGAKMVPFAGWEMPVQYEGIIQEHKYVREHAGIFDVSHMGRLIIRGPDAAKLLDYLSVTPIAGKKPFSANYTVWCRESGGSVDDLIVYKLTDREFFIIVNASNREKDLEHLKTQSKNYDVTIESRYEDGILAVQGPQAIGIVSKILGDLSSLKPMQFISLDYKGEKIIVAGTGYTGAGGFEIYAATPLIIDLWDRFIEAGVKPIGLGARDTLRLEMGYALYGHELSETIAPTESVSAWTVKWDHDFLGKDALEKLENHKRHAYGIVLTDKGIAREGYEVLLGNTSIGIVTSGTQSPSINQAIALVLVDRKLQDGDTVEVMIRGRRCQARVAKLPFI